MVHRQHILRPGYRQTITPTPDPDLWMGVTPTENTIQMRVVEIVKEVLDYDNVAFEKISSFVASLPLHA